MDKQELIKLLKELIADGTISVSVDCETYRQSYSEHTSQIVKVSLFVDGETMSSSTFL